MQSVAVRLIVERERERIAFVRCDLLGSGGSVSDRRRRVAARRRCQTVDGRKIPSGKDFDSTTGKLKKPKLLQLDEQQSTELAAKLRSADFKVTSVEVKPFTERPRPPFTTSTLQQEANRKLGFTAQRTMRAAQKLYENGYITYMRTDSTTLSKEAIGAARDLVRSEYGDNFLHPDVRVYAGKVKNAQEAHEAIRPAGTPFRVPETVQGRIGLGSIPTVRTDLETNDCLSDGGCQKATGQHHDRRGRSDVHRQRHEHPVRGVFAGLCRRQRQPRSRIGQPRNDCCRSVDESDPLTVDSHSIPKATRPSRRPDSPKPRLTRTLEEKGIGRPSTYASIIGTITDERRNYIFKKGSALVPSWRAFSVTRLMEDAFWDAGRLRIHRRNGGLSRRDQPR